jgi:hypothetical protein
MNGRQKNATNAQILGKKKDTNYDGKSTARHLRFLWGYIEEYANRGTRNNVVRLRRPDWDT